MQSTVARFTTFVLLHGVIIAFLIFFAPAIVSNELFVFICIIYVFAAPLSEEWLL